MQKKIKSVIVVAAVAALCASTAAFAYLTNHDEKEAVFAVGNVAGILLDTPANTSAGTYLSPGETITTSPKVQNTGKGDAVVFVEMQVPAETVKTCTKGQDGSYTVSATATEQALFEEVSEISDKWKVYEAPQIVNGVETTLFVYKTVVPSESTTEAIFNNLNVINTTSLNENSYEVKFKAKMIQAEGIAEGELSNEELEKASTAIAAHSL